MDSYTIVLFLLASLAACFSFGVPAKLGRIAKPIFYVLAVLCVGSYVLGMTLPMFSPTHTVAHDTATHG